MTRIHERVVRPSILQSVLDTITLHLKSSKLGIVQASVNVLYLLADNIKLTTCIVGELHVSIVTSILTSIKFHKTKSESATPGHGMIKMISLLSYHHFFKDDSICELLHLLESWTMTVSSSLMQSSNISELLFHTLEECMYNDNVSKYPIHLLEHQG